MTDTPDTDDTQADVDGIQQRLNAFYGFYHEYRDIGWVGENVLAELDAEGKWRTWDQRAPYSKEACEFIAAAPADLRALLRERDARERRLAKAKQRIEQHIAEYEARIKLKQANLDNAYDPDLELAVTMEEAFCDGMGWALRHLIAATKTEEQENQQP